MLLKQNQTIFRIEKSIFKRFMDISISTLFIILIGIWLFPIFSVIIYFLLKEKTIFIQDRVGKDNTVFKCFKFKTIKYDKNNQIINIPFCNFLRKTHIDELPQMINVFLGNMSLVGPRPHALKFQSEYKNYVDDITFRQKVRPGITGLAQILGYNGDVDDLDINRELIKKRIYFDEYYIKNWTIKLDVIILIKTLFNIKSSSEY